MSNSKIIDCSFCGRKVKKYLSQLKMSKTYYCSHECFYNDVRKNKILNRADRKVIKCLNCNKDIELVGYDVRSGRKKYCSKKCMDEYRKTLTGLKNPKYEPDKHIERKCKWCGKLFITNASWVKRGESSFCSRNCNGAYQIRKSQNCVSKVESEFGEELRLMGYNFETQSKIGSFVSDFYLRDKNLIIEFDGDYWHSLPNVIEKDRRKYKYYSDNGYRCIRIKECNYKRNKINVLNELKNKIDSI